MAKRGSTTGKKSTTSRTTRSAPAAKRAAARPAARPAAPRSAARPATATRSATATRPAARPTARPAEPAAERAPRRRTAPVLPTEPSPVEAPIVMSMLSPAEMYQREKSRRENDGRVTSDPIAEARREYLALLAAEAAAGKGGRPKGSGRPRPGAAPAAPKLDDDE